MNSITDDREFWEMAGWEQKKKQKQNKSIKCTLFKF